MPHFMWLTGLRSWLFGGHKFGVMNAWRLASFSSCAWHLFRHIRSRSRCLTYGTLYRTGRDPYISISGVWNGRFVAGFLGWVPAPLHSVCVVHFGLPLPCIRSVLHVNRSLVYNPFVQFLPGNSASRLREQYPFKIKQLKLLHKIIY